MGSFVQFDFLNHFNHGGHSLVGVKDEIDVEFFQLGFTVFFIKELGGLHWRESFINWFLGIF